MSIPVLYFFQCEAGESQTLPNAFMIPKGADGEPTFGTFLEHFPIKNQSLHFRFKWESGNNQDYMWLDMTSGTDKLPISEGQIMAKVLKLDDVSAFRRRKILRYKKAQPSAIAAAVMRGSNSTENVPPAPSSSSSGSRITPPPSQQSAARVVTPPPQHEQQQQSPQSTGVVDNMLIFSGDEADSKPRSNGGGGAMGLDIHDTAEDSMMSGSAAAEEPAAPLMSRQELAARREQDIDDKVQEALEEKRERDRKEETESAETEAARLKHDANLKNWTYKNNAKRDVRSLLSNMHTVTWPGARWKQIGLGDLLEPRQVKLQYRKAMLVVHPDRCSSMDTETKFIAKRLFEGINEAYEEFLKKESV